MAGIEGDIWRQEYDHSKDPKREPGPIEFNRYVINSHTQVMHSFIIDPEVIEFDVT